MIPKVLLVGCGDILTRFASKQEECAFWGIRRNVTALPASIQPLEQDLNDHNTLVNCFVEHFDYWLITLTPAARTASAYQQAYVANLRALLSSAAALGKMPKHLFFISSTSIYGDAEGWVNEKTKPQPSHFSGSVIRDAEALIKNSYAPYSHIRFSGIYGPGRYFLINSVKNQTGGERDGYWSNRIHVEDCAGVLNFLLQRLLAGNSIPQVLLASDCAPTALMDVKSWLAERLTVDYIAPKVKKISGKRCDNKALLALGYQFVYPDFRSGYRAVLEAQ